MFYVKQANIDIRTLALSKGVRLWEVAEKMGIAEGSLSRKLRVELPPEEKHKIAEIIENIAKEHKEV